MANKQNRDYYFLTNYLEDNLEPLSENNLNELDFAIFCKLSYYNFGIFKDLIKKGKAIKIKDYYDLRYIKDFLKDNYLIDDEYNFFITLVSNPRFKNIKVSYYKEKLNTKKSEEFTAITFDVKKFKIIAFRGTTLNYHGWKENFEMTFQYPIPSQASALKYLNHEINLSSNIPIYLCGHSKGGNLAIYSYLNLDKKHQEKVRKIYVYDSPGLENYDTSIAKLNGVLEKFCPYASVIGMLFDDRIYTSICKSNADYFLQHDIFNWQIDKKTYSFYKLLDFNPLTNLFNLRLNNYVRGKNLEDRKFAVTLLFKLIKNVNFTSDNDIKFDVFNIYKQLKDEFIKEPVEVRNKAKKLMSEILNYLIKGK